MCVCVCWSLQGVVEFSLCLLFAKLVSYTFLFWLPLYITKAGEDTTGFSTELYATQQRFYVNIITLNADICDVTCVILAICGISENLPSIKKRVNQ